MPISNKGTVAAVVVALVAPGLVLAHRGGPMEEGSTGDPKNYCENPVYVWEDVNGDEHARATHNYNAAVSGHPVQDHYNLGEVRTHDYGPLAGGLMLSAGFLSDGNLAGDCDGDGMPGDFDRHAEYAHGGAFLLARSTMIILADPTGTFTGDGAEDCWGRTADHDEAIEGDEPELIHIYVSDLLWGAAVDFVVASDWDRAAAPSAATGHCGDGVIEPCDDPSNDVPHVTCNPRDRALYAPPDFSGGSGANVAAVAFIAGADGAYQVFVGNLERPATSGHIWTGDQPPPEDGIWATIRSVLLPSSGPTAGPQCGFGSLEGGGLRVALAPELFRFWSSASDVGWHVVSGPPDAALMDTGDGADPVRLWYTNNDLTQMTYESGPWGREPSRGTATSPFVRVMTGQAGVYFASRYEVEANDALAHDLMRVQASGDNGVTWLDLCTVHPLVAYHGTPDESSCSNGAPGGAYPCPWDPTGTVTRPQWEARTARLPASLGGRDVRIRFAFDTVDGQQNSGLGWMVGDVQVSPAIPSLRTVVPR